MGLIESAAPPVVIARAADSELLADRNSSVRLLLDATDTGGTISAHRVLLRDGAIGAEPHRHRLANEVFHVLDGVVDLLAGDQMLTATAGDLIVVPSKAAHAFGAAVGHDAELLVLVTPGIDRFDFFRTVYRIRAGLESQTALAEATHRYDNHPAPTGRWDAARSRNPSRKSKR